jgi:2,3-bisphosphoglycerate-independent phosphoglycerate mutase
VKKTIMVHIDGIPTGSFEELGARTLLEAANLPNLDDLTRYGELGRLGVPRESRVFSGELALLGLLGYDTQKWYAGLGAFESLSLEVVLDRYDVAFLCDFVTLRAADGWGDGKKLGPLLVMDDVSGGGLETEEAREFIDTINEQLVSENIQFYLGQHSHHLMLWVGGNAKICCRNPQDVIGISIDAYLPTGEGSQVLRELMEASRTILCHHSVNKERVDSGLKPANCLWLWGPGKSVELPQLKERWPIQGTVVSPNGPYVGVGKASGLHMVKVGGMTENESERLRKMADGASRILEEQDLVCLHIPFSALALQQEPATPASMFVQYLEQVDEHLMGPLQQLCMKSGEIRLFVVATSCANKAEEDVNAYARYMLYEGQKADSQLSSMAFHDQEVLAHPLQNATTFFERFFGKL